MNNMVKHPNLKPIFIASGTSLSKAPEPSAFRESSQGTNQLNADSIEMNYHNDNLLIQNEKQVTDRNIQELEKKEQELNAMIDSIKDETGKKMKMYQVIQKYERYIICGLIAPTFFGVLFTPAITTALGTASLSPVIQESLLILLLGEAVTMAGAVHMLNKYVKNSKEMEIEAVNLERKKKNIADVKDMITCKNCESINSAIQDEEEFIEISGLKVKKHKFNHFNPVYTVVKK